MADVTRSSFNLARDVEMANRGEPYLSVGSMFMIDICFLVTSYTSINHFTQGENEGYQADGDENARNIPTHVHGGDKIDEDFDPWALPELQDFGPKWSGRLHAIVYVATRHPSFYLKCRVLNARLSCGETLQTFCALLQQYSDRNIE